MSGNITLVNDLSTRSVNTALLSMQKKISGDQPDKLAIIKEISKKIDELQSQIDALKSEWGGVIDEFVKKEDVTDSVSASNYNPITSSAVARETIFNKNFYDANTDRTDVNDRINAMQYIHGVIGDKADIWTVRYAGGYYYTYIFSYRYEKSILEINPYNGTLSIFGIFNGRNVHFIRTI